MNRGIPILRIVVALAFFSASLGTSVVGQPGGTAGPLALVGGTIVPGPTEEPIRDGVVLVGDGRIGAVGRRASVPIPKGIETIDCAGLTITAGFWNSHAHFFERKWTDAATLPPPELDRQLQDMITRYGFTAVFDLASPWENTRRIRDRIESGEVPGPRIRSTGEALIAPGAVPSDAVLSALGDLIFRNFEIAEPSQAAAAAKTLVERGADGIKVHLQPPPPPGSPFPISAMPIVVNEAHRAGKPVFVHPSNGSDVLAAARAGVDVIAHTTPSSGPWDDTILAAMKEQRVALMPTLTVWKELLRHERTSMQERFVRTSIGQLRAWVVSGGVVLFGNDLGAVSYNPIEEYTLMAEAGMRFSQILTSLTTAPAEQFGMSTELGRIAPGFRADLAILEGDPAKDLRSLAAIRYTLRDGKIIYRASR